jgi:hypothetical protein
MISKTRHKPESEKHTVVGPLKSIQEKLTRNLPLWLGSGCPQGCSVPSSHRGGPGVPQSAENGRPVHHENKASC